MKFRRYLSSIVLSLCMAVFCLVATLSAQNVTTVAGGFVGDGGRATNASFEEPFAVAYDKNGNLYVSDFAQNRVRKITRRGAISTFAGTGISGYNGDNIQANTAELSYPNGLAYDAQQNVLFIADGGNFIVRKVDLATNIITTYAGTPGVFGDGGDGGPANQATMGQAYGLALDHGTLYISDVGQCVVRNVDSGGIIHTYAGNATCGYNGDGIPATQANLNFPRGLTVDTNHKLYIADLLNHRVRVVSPAGQHIITTFAGTGNPGFSGDGGPATSANIGNPRGLTFHNGAVYMSNTGGQRIRFVDINTGIINTFVGSGFGYDGDNNLTVLFNLPTGIVFNPTTGNLVMADSLNARVRTAVSGVMNTIGGGFIGDGGKATSAALVEPLNLAFDRAGNYYIADAAGNRIRKVDTTGKITTIAGTGVSGYTGDGGLATAAQLYFPEGVAVDANGNIFIADTVNGVIRKVDFVSKNISTFATDPNFNDLVSLAVDKFGNIYSADDGACVVRKITPGGTITVVAGMEFICGYAGDHGPATSAQLNGNYGVAVDGNGNLFIGDSANNVIRRVSPGGIITTIAGDGNCGFLGDGGPATSAEMCFPLGLTVDAAGNVYVADEINVRIRKIAGGKINTVAGTGVAGYNGDGLPALSTNLDDPVSVAVNPKNKAAYLLDDQQTQVRVIH